MKSEVIRFASHLGAKGLYEEARKIARLLRLAEEEKKKHYMGRDYKKELEESREAEERGEDRWAGWLRNKDPEAADKLEQEAQELLQEWLELMKNKWNQYSENYIGPDFEDAMMEFFVDVDNDLDFSARRVGDRSIDISEDRVNPEDTRREEIQDRLADIAWDTGLGSYADDSYNLFIDWVKPQWPYPVYLDPGLEKGWVGRTIEKISPESEDSKDPADWWKKEKEEEEEEEGPSAQELEEWYKSSKQLIRTLLKKGLTVEAKQVIKLLRRSR